MSDGRDTLAPPALPPRNPRGHKGSFGTVAIVGGCAFGGNQDGRGAALAALGAAVRRGARRRLICPEPCSLRRSSPPPPPWVAPPTDGTGAIIAHQAAALLDSVLGRCDALAIGPGLGSDPQGRRGVQVVVLRRWQQDEKPVVVDATRSTP